jgi:hypothetical protein
VFSCPPSLHDLPVVSGAGQTVLRPGDAAGTEVLDALAVIDYCERFPVGQDVRVGRISVDGENVPRDGTLKIELSGGELIYFWFRRGPHGDLTPPADMIGRLEYLRDALLEVKGLGKRIATMDLTFDEYRGYAPVTYRQG